MIRDERSNAEPDDEFRLDIFRTVERRGRTALLIALVAAALAALSMGVSYLRQPVFRSASLEFRPTFSGAAEAQYPNGLPFSVSDIVAASVVDIVYEGNGIEAYCGRDLFKGSFFVEQQSAEYSFLENEYQARLADARLTPVDRERLQAEYRARRASIPLQYRLVFVATGACQSVPEPLLAKALSDVLLTWAEQSELRRGVLRLRLQVLSPSVLDVGLASDGSRLIRADLVRSALRRLVANVREVEERPGVSVMRFGENRTTFAEIRAKLEDLIQARLEPLVVTSGLMLGAESRAWAQEALNTAAQEEATAEGKVLAYRTALREYSGPAATSPVAAGTGTSGDVRTQIDRSLIDKFVDMSDANAEFRQELTRKMVEADVAASESRARVSYYRNLASSLRRGSGGSLTPEDIDQRLASIVADGKNLAAQFNALYDEWSTVSLRPASGMYRADAPVRDVSSRAGRLVTIPLAALAMFFVALVAALLFFIARDHYAEWRLRRAPRTST